MVIKSIIGATCACLTVLSININAALIFEDDFESGNLDKWTIGGRQITPVNIANTVTRYGSTMGHLYKSSFTEITLEKEFAYDSLLNFMLDIEVTSNGTSASGTNFYAYSGLDFRFYDSTGTRIGLVTYGTASTNYLSDIISPADPTWHLNELTEGALLNLDLGITDILSNITIDETSIDSVTMYFRTYTSYYGSATAELWVDNVCVDQGDVCVADSSVVPVPAAVWLFGSGLLGLVGVARRKKA